MQMQCIAREFNLPETIFIQQPESSENTAKVRIFTPKNELPFAGHPSIGCAIFLAERQNQSDTFSTTIKLEEVAGLVEVEVDCVKSVPDAQLTAPVIPLPHTTELLQPMRQLDVDTAANALNLNANDILAAPGAHAGGPTFLFVPLTTLGAVSKATPAQPLFDELTASYGAATGLFTYYLDTKTNEIDARMFAPAAGIPEDPATGSAAAILAAQLLVDGQLKNGANNFLIRQGFDMGRASYIRLSIKVQDAALQSVKVGGSSVSISSGKMRMPV